MPIVTLRLEFSSRPLREASAWLITGCNPGAWVEEIIRWNIPDGDLDLFLISEDPQDPVPGGVLVCLPQGGPGTQPRTRPRAIAYGEVHPGIWIPAHSQLLPTLSSEDLKTFKRYERWVGLPGSRWIGFEERDRKRLANLFSSLPTRQESWNQARAGEAWNQKIVSIEIDKPLARLEREWPSAPRSLGNLPVEPSQEESSKEMPTEDLGALRRWVQKRTQGWLKSKFHSLPSHPPSPPSPSPTQREQELKHLLELLEKNPDEGLSFAIPLVDRPSQSSTTAGGNHLVPHSTEFKLSTPDSSEPFAAWEISQEMEQQLRRRYQELFALEIQKGNFVKAAYIQAQLLGDWNGAVSALKQGGLFFEAAEVLKTRLMRPADAARCYLSGGYFTLAAPLFDLEGMLEEAGDCWEKAHESDKARLCFEKAVQSGLLQGRTLDAARILEDRLGRTQEALRILEAAWRESKQPLSCLEHHLILLKKHHNPGGRLRIFQEMQDFPWRPSQENGFLTLLLRQWNEEDSEPLRRVIRSVVQTRVGRLIKGVSKAVARDWLNFLIQVSPGDGLLIRDMNRYLSRQRDIDGPEPVSRKGSLKIMNQPLPVRSFSLSLPDVQWKSACSVGWCCYAAGFSSLVGIIGARINWTGAVQQSRWESSCPANAGVWLKPSMTPDGPVLIHQPKRREGGFEDHVFEGSEAFFYKETVMGTPDWFPDLVQGFSVGHQSYWILRWTKENQRLVLSSYQRNGYVIANFEAPDWLAALCSKYPVSHLQLCGNSVVLAIEKTIVTFHIRQQRWSRDNLDQNVTQMNPLVWNGSPYLLVSWEIGLSLMRPDKGKWTPIDQTWDQPRTVFLKEGGLLVESPDQCAWLTWHGGTLSFKSEYPPEPHRVLALLPGEQPNEFARFNSDGTLSILRLPENPT